MYNINNLYTDINMTVTNKGEKVSFEIANLINTRLKNELLQHRVFQVLNKYLDYKGESFKTKLYGNLKTAYDDILINSMSVDLDPLPISITHNILDMFDLDDVVKFLKDNKIIRYPSILGVSYDGLREQNDQGSREQTYLIDDYFELIGLITIIKATLPVVGMYVTLKKGSIAKQLADYIILNFYMSHNIYDSAPFVKLHDYIDKLVGIASQKEDFSKRIIESNKPKDEMAEYVLASALFQRLAYTNEIDDVEDKHAITKLYSFVINNIKLKATENSSSIRIKNPVASNTSESNESESEMETNRTPVDITFGHIEEFKFALSDPYMLLTHLNLNRHKSMFNKVYQYFKDIPIGDIPEFNVDIGFWIVKDIIDYRAISYVDLEQIINVLTVSFVWCIENNHLDIANILASNTLTNVGEVFKYNAGHKNKISKENKDRLNDIFPYHGIVTVKDVETYVNYTEVAINKMSVSMGKSTLMSILPDSVHMDFFDMDDKIVRIPSDIKNKLVDLIINVNS